MLKVVVVAAVVTVISLSSAWGQTATPAAQTAPAAVQSGSPKPDDRNKALSDAASINEDLIGFALDGEAGKVAESVAAMKKALPSLRPLVDDKTFEALTRQTGVMDQALAKKDILATALASAECYRAIEVAIGSTGRTAPLEVAMLDYSGFKLSVLAAAKKPEWARIAAAAKESREFWSAAAKSVPDKSMKNLFEAIEKGLESAAGRKDVNGLKFAAKVQLEAVDVLEQYFRGTYKK